MFKELAVPLLVLGVLATIILPIPPIALDFLIVSNLILALVLFVSTLYLSDALKLSSLPSLLLLATLYRLALNISTSRSILSHGDAGEVVDAFGSLVIQDNILVGVVIFLIITLVQFIVKAKGAERVAEVSARFTLDALPGKQMSIDADVRAGLIDFPTARSKRQDLQTESRFYGALDGAMKFVKGDAIAGIVITIFNIIGGLITGLAIEGLDLSSAVSRYTRLTIGDGLVAQIPALLNSLAAGIVVTRVTRGDNSSLATDLISQIGQVRAVKIMIGCLSLIVAMAPGMPLLPFLTLSTLLFASAAFDRAGKNSDVRAEQPVFAPRPPAPLRLEIGVGISRNLGGSSEATALLGMIREKTFAKLGIVLSVPEFAVHPKLDNSFRVVVRGFNQPEESSELSGRDLMEFISSRVPLRIESKILDFVDDISTRRCLDYLEELAPDLVSSTIPQVITLTQLTELLKCLLREGIPISHFDCIIQAVAENGGKSANERALLEAVREQLRYVIVNRFKEEDGVLRCITLDPVADLSLARAEREQRVLELTLVDRICQELGTFARPFPVVVGRGARRLLSDYLRIKGLKNPVLAQEELAEDVRIEVIGRLSLLPEERGEMIDRLAA